MMQPRFVVFPALRGALFALAAAALVGALSRKRIVDEAHVLRTDLPRLLAMAAFGAVVGPVALAGGLQRTSGTSASLMLTLEALFTVVLPGAFTESPWTDGSGRRWHC